MKIIKTEATQGKTNPVMDIIVKIKKLFSSKKYQALPQHFTRVTERFDVIQRSAL